ncbi:hypothetical protein D5086_030482 [Populus alba]|uniref:Uncharacterized protein n=1 Tax=Populus alba TaxID=43335 RepID=A0ACC4APE7_POPAL
MIQRQQERQGGGAAAHLLEQHVMAAKESGEFLHGAVALGAFQGLGDPTSSHWELKAGARMNNVMKIFMDHGRQPCLAESWRRTCSLAWSKRTISW